MGANGTGLGVEPRPGIVLPAPCLGHPLGKPGSCSNEGTITLLTTIADPQDGGPMPVILTVCPKHVRPARHWLEPQACDEIDTYATSTFAEHFDIVRDSGFELVHLTRQAS